MVAPLAEQINEALAGYERLFGLEVTEVSETDARATVRVRDELKQAYGLVHGGVYASIAESLTSWATAIVVARQQGAIALGMANSTSFLRPITQGAVHASARRVHAGSTTWVWDVDFRDDDDLLCAVTRMTIAVRPQRREPEQSSGQAA
jgi:1,4-dihydroxy-2-naphthoyl-CoA hydrolase